MNTRTLAQKLLTAHGPAALPIVTARGAYYSHAIQRDDKGKRYGNIARYLARKLVWDAIAHHLRDLSKVRHS
jgi:hypothetical protein